MSAFVKPVAWTLGIVLLVLGILGFVMPSPLLGLLEVDTIHNVVHIVSGLAGLFMARNWGQARMFLMIFGLIYGVIGVVGFLTGGVFDLFVVNQADHYLHLAIAAVCLVVGFGSKRP